MSGWVRLVVPLGVEVVPYEVLGFQISHLGVGDLDSFGVEGVVEFGGDFQSGAGCGSRDEVDDDFVACQGLPRQFIEI